MCKSPQCTDQFMNDTCCMHHQHWYSSRRQYDTPILTRVCNVPAKHKCLLRYIRRLPRHRDDDLHLPIGRCLHAVGIKDVNRSIGAPRRRYSYMPVSVRKVMLVAGILQNLARHRLCLGSACWTYEARALRSRINASFSA